MSTNGAESDAEEYVRGDDEDEITEEQVEACKQFLKDHMPDEIDEKNSLAAKRKESKPYKDMVKAYIRQNGLDHYTVSDLYTINAPRKPVQRVTKTAVLGSRVLTGKKRKEFLSECTSTQIVWKEVFGGSS